MREREGMVTSSLILLMLVLWLGFVVHRSPRFPGSLLGGVLGVSGALLMLSSLAYSLVKRKRTLKGAVTKRVPMRTLLAWHVYTGVAGAVLAILHTGHKFNNPLGISLTALMLLAVLSGFVGRHFMKYVSQELHEKQDMLKKLREAYRQTADELARHPGTAPAPAAPRGLFARLSAAFFTTEEEAAQGRLALTARAVRLAESVADLEYAVKTHELLKRRFALWLKVHIFTSIAFYALLALHVWAAVYFGLRWFN